MSRNFRCVKFVNLSMSSLGWRFLPRMLNLVHKAFRLKKWQKPWGRGWRMLYVLDMMNHDTGIVKKQQHYIIKKNYKYIH